MGTVHRRVPRRDLQLGIKPTRFWEKWVLPRERTDPPREVKLSLVRDRIRRKGKLRSDKINKKGKFQAHHVGDHVLVKTCNLSNAEQGLTAKFLALYEGPFTIFQRKGDTTYIVSDVNGKQRGLFHQSQLRLYYGAKTSEEKGQEETVQDDSRS